LLVAVILGSCSLWLRFHGDFHLHTRFEAYLLAVFVRQRVFDAYLSIQIIGAFNGDLRFLWFVWIWGLDNLFDRCRQGGTGFFAHNLLERNEAW
jgi:hypothetical protein